MPVYSGVSKEKNILKTIKILLLMVQFHNAPSNFANLASGETGIRDHNLFQNNWKRQFSQNSSHNDAKKNRLQDFYDIFARVGDEMTKTGTADCMKCASRILVFRTRRAR